MKILVLNGSPKRENSDCLKLTRAFLQGMGEEAEVLNAIYLHVNPCKGCFGCWQPGAKGCVQRDDMDTVMQKLTAAELVIFSFPLYCYGMPAPLKAVVDRLLPLSTSEQRVDEDGRTYHPSREKQRLRFMMISGCGFPNMERNFESAQLQFACLFGKDFPRINCLESPMLSISEAQPAALPYLALCEQAGREFAAQGRISEETQRRLDAPMLDPDEYRRRCNGDWDE